MQYTTCVHASYILSETTSVDALFLVLVAQLKHCIVITALPVCKNTVCMDALYS